MGGFLKLRGLPAALLSAGRPRYSDRQIHPFDGAAYALRGAPVHSAGSDSHFFFCDLDRGHSGSMAVFCTVATDVAAPDERGDTGCADDCLQRSSSSNDRDRPSAWPTSLAAVTRRDLS